MKKHLFQKARKGLLISLLTSFFVMAGVSAFSSKENFSEAKADETGVDIFNNGQLFSKFEAESHFTGSYDGFRDGNNWSNNRAVSIPSSTYLSSTVTTTCAGIYTVVVGLNHGDPTTATVTMSANNNNNYSVGITTGSWDSNAGPKIDWGFLYLQKGTNNIKVTFTGSNGWVHFDYFAVSENPTRFEAEDASHTGTEWSSTTSPYTSTNSSNRKTIRTTKTQYIEAPVYLPSNLSGNGYALSVAYYSDTINPLVSLYIDSTLIQENINLRYINGLSTFIKNGVASTASRFPIMHRIKNISVSPGGHTIKLVNAGSAGGGGANIDFDYFVILKTSTTDSPAYHNELALIHDMNGKSSLYIEAENACAYPGYDDFANPSKESYFNVVYDYNSSNNYRAEYAHAGTWPAYEVLNVTEGWYSLSFDGVPWFSNESETVTLGFSSHQNSKAITRSSAKFIMTGKTQGWNYTNMETEEACKIYLNKGDNIIMYNYEGGEAYFDVDRFKLTLIEPAGGRLSYAESSVSVNYGVGTYTQTLTNTGSTTPTYTSSNTGVATVDSSGIVTFNRTGTVTITASVNNPNYFTPTASYTLRIYKINSSDGHLLIKLNDAWKTNYAKTAIHFWRKVGDDVVDEYWSKIIGDDQYLSTWDAYLIPIPEGGWTHAQAMRINKDCTIDEESWTSTNPYNGYVWSWSVDISFESSYNWYQMSSWQDGKMNFDKSNHPIVAGGESVYLDLSTLPGWEADGAILGVYLQNGLGSSSTLSQRLTRVEGFDIGGSGENHLYELKIPSNQAFKTARFYRDNPAGGNWQRTADLSIVAYKNVCKVTGWDSGDKICPSSFDWNMQDTERANYYGIYFLSQTGEQCEHYDTNTASSFTTIWSNVSGQYNNMSDESKSIFTNCNTIDPNIDTKYKDAAQRYDYILGKYGTDILSDFASRDGINVSYSDSAKNPFGHLLINGELDYSVIIIIIASSIALLSITTLSILLVKKRKSKPID